MANKLNSANVLYTPTSSNRKTGNIPQQWVGSTYEQTRQSCAGCPLLIHAKADKSASNKRAQKFGQACYAHYGFARMGFMSLLKRNAEGRGDYSLDFALQNRNVDAKYVRFGAIGDPSAINDTTLKAQEKKIRKLGLGILSYTHFWKDRGKHLKGRALASCDNWQDVEQATKEGWRAAIHVDARELELLGVMQTSGATLAGARWSRCPAELKKASCNTCGLCDATRQVVDIIVFTNH